MGMINTFWCQLKCIGKILKLIKCLVKFVILTYLIRHLKIKLIILPILDLGNGQLFGFIQFTFGRILYQEKYISYQYQNSGIGSL